MSILIINKIACCADDEYTHEAALNSIKMVELPCLQLTVILVMMDHFSNYFHLNKDENKHCLPSQTHFSVIVYKIPVKL